MIVVITVPTITPKMVSANLTDVVGIVTKVINSKYIDENTVQYPAK